MGFSDSLAQTFMQYYLNSMLQGQKAAGKMEELTPEEIEKKRREAELAAQIATRQQDMLKLNSPNLWTMNKAGDPVIDWSMAGVNPERQRAEEMYNLLTAGGAEKPSASPFGGGGGMAVSEAGPGKYPAGPYEQAPRVVPSGARSGEMQKKFSDLVGKSTPEFLASLTAGVKDPTLLAALKGGGEARAKKQEQEAAIKGVEIQAGGKAGGKQTGSEAAFDKDLLGRGYAYDKEGNPVFTGDAGRQAYVNDIWDKIKIDRRNKTPDDARAMAAKYPFPVEGAKLRPMLMAVVEAESPPSPPSSEKKGGGLMDILKGQGLSSFLAAPLGQPAPSSTKPSPAGAGISLSSSPLALGAAAGKGLVGANIAIVKWGLQQPVIKEALLRAIPGSGLLRPIDSWPKAQLEQAKMTIDGYLKADRSLKNSLEKYLRPLGIYDHRPTGGVR